MRIQRRKDKDTEMVGELRLKSWLDNVESTKNVKQVLRGAICAQQVNRHSGRNTKQSVGVRLSPTKDLFCSK